MRSQLDPAQILHDPFRRFAVIVHRRRLPYPILHAHQHVVTHAARAVRDAKWMDQLQREGLPTELHATSVEPLAGVCWLKTRLTRRRCPALRQRRAAAPWVAGCPTLLARRSAEQRQAFIRP